MHQGSGERERASGTGGAAQVTDEMDNLNITGDPASTPSAAPAAAPAVSESSQKQGASDQQQEIPQADAKSSAGAASPNVNIPLESLESKFRAFVDQVLGKALSNLGEKLQEQSLDTLLNGISGRDRDEKLNKLADQLNPMPTYPSVNPPEASPQLAKIISALQKALQQEQSSVEDVKKQLTAWKKLVSSQETPVKHMLMQDKGTKLLMKAARLLLTKGELSFLIETLGDVLELNCDNWWERELIRLHAYVKGFVAMAHLGPAMSEEGEKQYQNLRKACQGSREAYEAEQKAIGLQETELKRSFINELLEYRIKRSDTSVIGTPPPTLESLKSTFVQKLTGHYRKYYDVRSYCFTGVEALTRNCIEIASEKIEIASEKSDKEQGRKILILAKATAQNLRNRLDSLRIQEVADSTTYKDVVALLAEIDKELVKLQP